MNESRNLELAMADCERIWEQTRDVEACVARYPRFETEIRDYFAVAGALSGVRVPPPAEQRRRQGWYELSNALAAPEDRAASGVLRAGGMLAGLVLGVAAIGAAGAAARVFEPPPPVNDVIQRIETIPQSLGLREPPPPLPPAPSPSPAPSPARDMPVAVPPTIEGPTATPPPVMTVVVPAQVPLLPSQPPPPRVTPGSPPTRPAGTPAPARPTATSTSTQTPRAGSPQAKDGSESRTAPGGRQPGGITAPPPSAGTSPRTGREKAGPHDGARGLKETRPAGPKTGPDKP